MEVNITTATPISADIITGASYTAGAGIDITNNVISAIPELFWCTYGTTTYAEITEALAANKMPVCMYNNKLYVYTVNLMQNTHGFAVFDGYNVRALSVTSNNNWTYNSILMQESLEALPSYSETGTQVLKNINGSLQWVNE